MSNQRIVKYSCNNRLTWQHHKLKTLVRFLTKGHNKQLKRIEKGTHLMVSLKELDDLFHMITVESLHTPGIIHQLQTRFKSSNRKYINKIRHLQNESKFKVNARGTLLSLRDDLTGHLDLQMVMTFMFFH